MLPRNGLWACTYTYAAVLLVLMWPANSPAVDCNNNSVEDAQDISGGTSQDCDLNAIPDECQPDSDGNGTIDACDNCGLRLTDNPTDDYWSFRQRSTSQGNVIWFDALDDVHYFDGSIADIIQPRVLNNVDLEAVANFVFGLGTGTNAGEVLAAWRRGTDFAWVWSNNGQSPEQANYTNPYDPTKNMNPEDVAIADGCVFMLLQASDPATSNLTKHVYKIDRATGDSTLLTNEFLSVTQNGGTGAEVNTLVTSDCKAAWSWCGSGNAGSCTSDLDLHYYNGSTTTVIDTNALALSFARGRLLYSKPVNGVVQLFLYDTNLTTPTPVQLTSLLSTERQILFAQTDGRNVMMLVGNSAGQDREIIALGGLRLTDAETKPTDNPPNPVFPFQLQRGQLLWTAVDSSVVYFSGRSFERVCSEGWLADGFVAQLRKSSDTGTDTEVFLATETSPDDAQQPSSPLLAEAISLSNGQVTVRWSTVLGATSYKVYYAQQSGVNASNYQTLPGGGLFTSVSSPAVIQGLATDQNYYFVVSALEGAMEGPVSPEFNASPCTDPTLDSDNDGTPDCSDLCPADPAKTAPGVCGCGVPETDTDGDGTPNCTDGCPDDPNKAQAGACGCGVADSDGDGDGTPDCVDNCPNDPAKTEPGVCGCGVPDVDTNENGVIDCEEDIGGETPEVPDDGTGCAPGLCGPGVAPILPMTLLGMAAARRIRRRTRRGPAR